MVRRRMTPIMTQRRDAGSAGHYGFPAGESGNMLMSMMVCNRSLPALPFRQKKSGGTIPPLL